MSSPPTADPLPRIRERDSRAPGARQGEGSRDRRRPLVLAALAAAVVIAIVLGLFIGSIAVPFDAVIHALTGATSGDPTSILIRELRLPRVLMAALVGGALATAGTAMQGLFRNPLADPGLVGVASGAAVSAVFSIVVADRLHIPPSFNPWFTPFAAFLGGLVAAMLAARLALTDGYTRVATLLLAGLAINAIAGAGIGLLTQLAGDSALREVTFWLFGSLSKSGWRELAAAAPLLVLVMVLLPREARALNALLLGEAEARHLGIEVERLKRRTMALIVLAVALAVAAAGVIGFVGLVVPHLLRLLVGPDHRWLLPASALGGAALLGFADLGARTLLAPAELPVGILTALVGGPVFLGMLLGLRRRVETW